VSNRAPRSHRRALSTLHHHPRVRLACGRRTLARHHVCATLAYARPRRRHPRSPRYRRHRSRAAVTRPMAQGHRRQARPAARPSLPAGSAYAGPDNGGARARQSSASKADDDASELVLIRPGLSVRWDRGHTPSVVPAHCFRTTSPVTVYPGSIPGVASNKINYLRGSFPRLKFRVSDSSVQIRPPPHHAYRQNHRRSNKRRPWIAVDRRTREAVLRLADRDQLERICVRVAWRIIAARAPARAP